MIFSSQSIAYSLFAVVAIILRPFVFSSFDGDQTIIQHDLSVIDLEYNTNRMYFRVCFFYRMGS